MPDKAAPADAVPLATHTSRKAHLLGEKIRRHTARHSTPPRAEPLISDEELRAHHAQNERAAQAHAVAERALRRDRLAAELPPTELDVDVYREQREEEARAEWTHVDDRTSELALRSHRLPKPVGTEHPSPTPEQAPRIPTRAIQALLTDPLFGKTLEARKEIARSWIEKRLKKNLPISPDSLAFVDEEYARLRERELRSAADAAAWRDAAHVVPARISLSPEMDTRDTMGAVAEDLKEHLDQSTLRTFLAQQKNLRDLGKGSAQEPQLVHDSPEHPRKGWWQGNAPASAQTPEPLSPDATISETFEVNALPMNEGPRGQNEILAGLGVSEQAEAMLTADRLRAEERAQKEAQEHAAQVKTAQDDLLERYAIVDGARHEKAPQKWNPAVGDSIVLRKVSGAHNEVIGVGSEMKGVLIKMPALFEPLRFGPSLHTSEVRGLTWNEPKNCLEVRTANSVYEVMLDSDSTPDTHVDTPSSIATEEDPMVSHLEELDRARNAQQKTDADEDPMIAHLAEIDARNAQQNEPGTLPAASTTNESLQELEDAMRGDVPAPQSAAATPPATERPWAERLKAVADDAALQALHRRRRALLAEDPGVDKTREEQLREAEDRQRTFGIGMTGRRAAERAAIESAREISDTLIKKGEEVRMRWTDNRTGKQRVGIETMGAGVAVGNEFIVHRNEYIESSFGKILSIRTMDNGAFSVTTDRGWGAVIEKQTAPVAPEAPPEQMPPPASETPEGGAPAAPAAPEETPAESDPMPAPSPAESAPQPHRGLYSGYPPNTDFTELRDERPEASEQTERKPLFETPVIETKKGERFADALGRALEKNTWYAPLTKEQKQQVVENILSFLERNVTVDKRRRIGFSSTESLRDPFADDVHINLSLIHQDTLRTIAKRKITALSRSDT